jgi:2-(1,2-epoxy-1,2-dihydrophenyl)acetyl-CoA isomerase
VDHVSDDSGQPPVTTVTDGAIRTIRLNRADAMNALDTPTKIALRDAVVTAAQDDAVRCVVLVGSGRAFCVGQDLREHIRLLSAHDPALWNTVVEHYNPIALTLATMAKPVVASMNGVAAGAGAAFALAADVRLMASSAGINLAFTAIALSADSGATWWLPRLVGPARARELLMMPRTIPAAECLALGLVTEVVPDEDLPARTAEVAGMLAAGPTVAYGAVRRAVAYSASHDLADSLAFESSLMSLTGSTADHQAAVEAFVGKRPPSFEGR